MQVECDVVEKRVQRLSAALGAAGGRRAALNTAKEQLERRLGRATAARLNQRQHGRSAMRTDPSGSIDAGRRLKALSLQPRPPAPVPPSPAPPSCAAHAARPSSGTLFVPPRLLPRTIESFPRHATISYADIVRASGSRSRIVDTNGATSWDLLNRCMQAKLAAMRCPIQDVCWLALTGYDAAPGLPMSYSFTLSTPECVASCVLFYLALYLECALISAVLRRPGTHAACCVLCAVCCVMCAVCCVLGSVTRWPSGPARRRRRRCGPAGGTSCRSPMPGGESSFVSEAHVHRARVSLRSGAALTRHVAPAPVVGCIGRAGTDGSGRSRSSRRSIPRQTCMQKAMPRSHERCRGPAAENGGRDVSGGPTAGRGLAGFEGLDGMDSPPHAQRAQQDVCDPWPRAKRYCGGAEPRPHPAPNAGAGPPAMHAAGAPDAGSLCGESEAALSSPISVPDRFPGGGPDVDSAGASGSFDSRDAAAGPGGSCECHLRSAGCRPDHGSSQSRSARVSSRCAAVRCGADTLCCTGPAARSVISSVCGRYRQCLPRAVLEKMCWASRQHAVTTLELFRAEQRQAGATAGEAAQSSCGGGAHDGGRQPGAGAAAAGAPIPGDSAAAVEFHGRLTATLMAMLESLCAAIDGALEDEESSQHAEARSSAQPLLSAVRRAAVR